jgi:hypothetical protein
MRFAVLGPQLGLLEVVALRAADRPRREQGVADLVV